MENTNQAPLHHESVDASVSHEVHSDGPPSPVVEKEDFDLVFWRMINDNEVDDDRDLFMPELPEFHPEMLRHTPNHLAGDENITWITFAATLCSIVCFSLGYGPCKDGTIAISIGSSAILQPNRLFVERMNVEQRPKNNNGPTLYAFKKQPPQDISSWSELLDASLQANTHKEWMYFLNEGSQINISYSAASSSKFLLMIVRGRDGYGRDYGDGYCNSSGQCMYDQSGPNTTLSRNIIQGNGIIQQNILLSGSYYVMVKNLALEVEEVELNISGRALIYDTSEAYYMCKLEQGRCVFKVLLLEENHVVLITPQFSQETSNGEWHVKLSYEPRWIIFFGSIVVMNGMMLISLQLRKKFCDQEHLCFYI